jgi:hypothetical protein
VNGSQTQSKHTSKQLQQSLPKNRRYNLTPAQRSTMGELVNCKDLVIHSTDKGLGPYVSARPEYITDVLQQHLLNDANYEFLPLATAKSEILKQRQRFLEIYGKHKDSLISEAEEVYFKRATTDDHLSQTRVPQFYGTYKVHKSGRRSRPVISSINSVPEIFSKWVDYWLEKVVGSLLPTYLRNA